MKILTSTLLIIAFALCAAPAAIKPDGPNPKGTNTRRQKTANTRRPRARKPRKPTPPAAHASPSGQPAHMAPQLEDIPPVKPRPTPHPPADKRNPLRRDR